MPISVLCPGCKNRFNVSDKFAGKKGPCPKCKAIITVPAAAPVEVKIHAPEEYASGGKDQKGRPITKPIPRKDVRAKPVAVAAIVGSGLFVLLLAFALRTMNLESRYPVIALGLAVISAPLAVAGYSFLRDDELEGYKGRELWIRAGICGIIFAVLWGVYWPLSNVMTGNPYEWLFVAPLFIAVGAGAAFACFDLDPTSGALLYCFYLLTTILLREASGLPHLWANGGGS